MFDEEYGDIVQFCLSSTKRFIFRDTGSDTGTLKGLQRCIQSMAHERRAFSERLLADYCGCRTRDDPDELDPPTSFRTTGSSAGHVLPRFSLRPRGDS